MKLIATEEAAKKLGISVRRVRALIAKGVLQAEKVGRDWVVDEHIVAKLKATPRPPGRPRKSGPST